MEKYRYKVTAYVLQGVWATIKGELKLVQRWKKVNSWLTEKKSLAYSFVRIWSKYRQPYFKATIQSLKRGGKKRGKR